MRYRSGTFALAAVLASTMSGGAAEPLPRATPESVGIDAARLREATALLRQQVADGKIAGAVAAVARRGRLVYLEAVGVQDLDSRTPMADTSLFRIYSMTKPVTSVAAMILHERGRFALADPVSKYLPEFKAATVAAGGTTRPPAREITVEDLLLHTSGLDHRTSDNYRKAQVRSRADTLPVFIGKLLRVPLMEDPGTRYRYSEGTTVVGRLVEIWSGRPFDRFVREEILAPLAMTDTTFQVTPAQRPRLTTVYSAASGRLTPTEIEAVPFTGRPALIEGAVGLVSTVPDYLRFSQMLLNKGELDGRRLLSAATVERMTANGLPDAVLKTRGGAMGWGLANVNVLLDPAGVKYPANRGEYGWDGSAGTIFWIDPTSELVTILMYQNQPANPDGIRPRFKTIVHQALTR